MRLRSLVLVFLFSALSPLIHADTFQRVEFDSDSRTPVLLTADGDIVTFAGSSCFGVSSSSHCYNTFYRNGTFTQTPGDPNQSGQR